MAVNVSEEWLLDHGVNREQIDAALAALIPDVARNSPVLTVPDRPFVVSIAGQDGWTEAVFANWSPASKNLKARGVRVWIRARQRDNAAIALWAAIPAWCPLKIKGKRRVTLRVERRRPGRLADPQNLIESLADSLVANRLLVDDSARWATFAEPVVEVNRELDWAWRTTVRLEDANP